MCALPASGRWPKCRLSQSQIYEAIALSRIHGSEQPFSLLPVFRVEALLFPGGVVLDVKRPYGV